LVVNPPVQYRFVGIMLAVLFVLTVGCLGSVYLALWTTMRTYDVGQDPFAVAQLSSVGLMVTVQVLLLAPIVVWVGLTLTHRLVGPLVRIQAALQQMAQGRYDIHLTLRKGDSLTELAELVNGLAATLRSRRP
jgi:signal transduction histidine kinase